MNRALINLLFGVAIVVGGIYVYKKYGKGRRKELAGSVAGLVLGKKIGGTTGAIVAGPVGEVVGTIVGGVTGYTLAHRKFAKEV